MNDESLPPLLSSSNCVTTTEQRSAKRNDALWQSMLQPLDKIAGWNAMPRDVLLLSHSHASPPPVQINPNSSGSVCTYSPAERYTHLSHWIAWTEPFPNPVSHHPFSGRFFYDQYTEKSLLLFKKPVKKFWLFTSDKLCNLLEQRCGIKGPSSQYSSGKRGSKGKGKNKDLSDHQRSLKNRSKDNKSNDRILERKSKNYLRLEEEEADSMTLSTIASTENIASTLGSGNSSMTRLHKLQSQLQEARKLNFAKTASSNNSNGLYSNGLDLYNSLRTTAQAPERKVLVPSRAFISEWTDKYNSSSNSNAKLQMRAKEDWNSSCQVPSKQFIKFGSNLSVLPSVSSRHNVPKHIQPHLHQDRRKLDSFKGSGGAMVARTNIESPTSTTNQTNNRNSEFPPIATKSLLSASRNLPMILK